MSANSISELCCDWKVRKDLEEWVVVGSREGTGSSRLWFIFFSLGGDRTCTRPFANLGGDS